MTVKDLIEELQKRDPNLVIALEVDGDAMRTGDYICISEKSLTEKTLRALTFGGCNSGDEDDLTRDSEYWAGEAFKALVL